jgi:membrane-associated protease RseP (regulator of RpoE activity)
LNTLLAITLGILSISIHELGHYEAMRRCGIKIIEVSLLGLPIRFLPSFYFKIKETIWGLHPFILGAYVKPHPDEDIRSRPLRERLYVYAGGPTANFVFALILIGLATFYSRFQANEIGKAWINLALYGGSAGIVWLIRRYLALILPVLSIPILFFAGYVIFGTDPGKAVESGSGGPVAIATLLSAAKSGFDVLVLVAVLNINLGLLNLLPLSQLDGGQMFGAILKQWCGEKYENAYRWVTLPILFSLIIYALGLDALRICKWIW